jgi:ankyrin repeat protein
LLLREGADIDVKGEHGYTPLLDAVEQGNLIAVTSLKARTLYIGSARGRYWSQRACVAAESINESNYSEDYQYENQ